MGDKFKRMVAALAATMVVVFGAVTPAHAAATDCPSGMFCLWVDGNYTGARWQISDSLLIDAHPANGGHVPGWISDIGSALYNRTGHDVYVFDGTACGTIGWKRLIPNGQKLTAPGSAINDRISSIQRWNAYPLACTGDLS